MSDDNSQFFFPDGIDFHCHTVPSENAANDGTNIVEIVGTPSNGYNAGKVHRFPLGRVIAIIEMEQPEPETDDEAHRRRAAAAVQHGGA